jgi:hypothetical protein
MLVSAVTTMAVVLFASCRGGDRVSGRPIPEAAVPMVRSPPLQEEACVDRWLADRELDRYGSPIGTLYAGGSPLFDEATGTTTSRVEYVYAKHPDARQACGSRNEP